MGKVRSVTVGQRRFTKYGDALNFFTALLNRYSVGSIVSSTDAADLHALLATHSEAEQKIGSGVSHFVVDRAPDNFPGKCFWIIREDGKDDFSIKHCLEPRPGD
ncbi:DCL family protein [Rhizobium leguminosarum]|nr:DCL family protein [Rhizobium leguminosarum]MBY5856393.1 DCL family protein [Rhizobium leguminosarum]